MGDPIQRNQQSFLPTQSQGNDRLTGVALLQAMKDLLENYTTQVGYSKDQKPYDIQVKVIDLTTARTDGSAEKIGFPFRSWFVVDATDATTKCNLKLHTVDSFAQGIQLSLKDSGFLTAPVSEAYITNTAQSGKTMTIIFSVSAEFRSGSQVSSTAGGVSITTGTAMTPGAPVAVSTVTQILSTDATRKQATIGNPRNSGADLWISGTNAVDDENGTTPGILLEPGDYYIHQGQGEIWGITSGAVVNVTIQSES